MKKMIALALRHRWLIALAFLLICVFGIYAWKQLSIDAYPDIADTTVQVVTQVPGLAAEEIEQQITIPLERALNGMPSLVMMRSNNTFGISTIMLVFQDGTEDYWARQRVRECIGDVDLPYDAVPELNPLTSPTGEVFRYILKSDNHTLRELTDLNKWVIIPRLTQIQGVADVSNYGGITTQYQIEIDPDKLTKYGISLAEVEESIEQNNSNAGGSMLTRGAQSYVVRSEGLITGLKDMENIVVKNVDGTPIYLGDLGNLKYGNLERKGILGFLNDEVDYEDGVEGIVQILRYQNPSEVLEKIHAAVEELNSDVLPQGVKIYPFLDRSNLVNTTLDTVSHTLFFGMLLVIGVLLVFLGSPRSALLVAITIPISLLIAFILMYLTDIPANLLSLGAIDFGILVDGAIVMMETILKKREDHPDVDLDKKDTVQRIAQVAKPVFFSTLIIIVAYMPLFSFERIEKKLFTPMAFTVGYALIGALMVSLILIPGMAYVVYRHPQKVFHNRVVENLTTRYRRKTAMLIEHPRRIFCAIGGILAAVVLLAVMVGKDFLPTLDEGGIWIQVQTPPGISLAQSAKMADSLRQVLKEFPEVTYVMTQVGRDDEGTEAFSPSHIECGVGLMPYSEWPMGRDKQDLIADMSERIAQMPGYKVGFSQPIIDMVMDQMAGSHSDLAVKVYGDDLTQTRHLAEQVVKVVSDIEGAVDVVIDQEPPLPQLKITADRDRIAQYGLNVADVADLIEVAIGGKAISQVFIGSKVYDVTCRYIETSRETPEHIGALMLTNSAGVNIPLSTVAKIETSLGASSIAREMNKRHLTVRLNLRGRDLTSFLSEAQARIAQEIAYDHTENQIRWDGQFENQHRAYTRLAIVVPFVLAFMFLLLFGAFGMFRQAGLLIAMLPLALLGGLLALVVRGMTFNVSSAVGFIALFGLTIQNGVIMISHINDLRRSGQPLEKAVVAGAAHRLRPVLMTATVAILGLMPASLASGVGSDVQRPLATVIVYGLLFSTIITLFILPTLYYRMERIALKDPKNSFLQLKNTGAALLVCCLLAPATSSAQGISYKKYIQTVAEKNAAYLAEKYNVDIATANLQAARVFNDPELSVDYGNNQDWSLQMGQSLEVGVSYDLDLAGVRKARIRSAQSEKEMTEASVNACLCNLRAEASQAWAEAWKQRECCKLLQSSVEDMEQIAQSDSIRLSVGDVGRTDACQSKLEAQTLRNEWLAQKAEYKNALMNLSYMTSGEPISDMEEEKLPIEGTEYTEPGIYDIAENNRADLRAAELSHTLSENNLKLVKASRAMEMGLNLGYSYNTIVRNEIAPAPKFHGLSVGVSIPLKFSNANKGELNAARNSILQSQQQYEAARQQVRLEVAQAYSSLQAARQVLKEYDGTLLSDARNILESRKEGYLKGESSLLELLTARQTYHDVMQAYIEACANCYICEVNLKQSIGY